MPKRYVDGDDVYFYNAWSFILLQILEDSKLIVVKNKTKRKKTKNKEQ
jgi:hypothetical protein